MKSSTLTRQTPSAFAPLLYPARYKGAYGGRGSGKSHDRGEALIEDHLMNPGMDSVCVREVQKSLKDSAKKLLETKIQDMGVGHMFEVQTGLIKAPGGGEIIFQGMQDHTAESIKSLEGFSRAWVEEAQTLSGRSLELLRPTIRAPQSEIWFSWNPRRKTDPVDAFLRGNDHGDDAIVIEANWRDNPWFPEVLELERQLDLKNNPERYEHIWEGGYATAFEGAYFAEQLNQCKRDGRIVDGLPYDPLLKVYAFKDIGGAGAKADAYTIWIVQFVNGKIHVLDYYESVGQTLDYHANWLRASGWGKAHILLPHDGTNTNNITGKKYADHWEDAGFQVDVVPNQGSGAAMQRIEAVRRVMPRVWFDEKKTEAGRDALGFYHEKKHDMGHGLGPEHDWSSHGADAFGLMALKADDLSTNYFDGDFGVQEFGAV